MRKKLFVAGIVGLLAGCVVFFAVQPLIIGQLGSPFLEHGSQLGLLFYIFPLLVLPFVCVAVVCFRPQSRAEAFKIAVATALLLLIPIPLLGYWIEFPKRVGFSAFSQKVLVGIAYSLVELIILALVASYVASWISVLVNRLFAHRT